MMMLFFLGVFIGMMMIGIIGLVITLRTINQAIWQVDQARQLLSQSKVTQSSRWN